jgi:hypothetical protein
MCQRFKEACARHFSISPEHVVLANSATSCFQAILDLWSALHVGRPTVKITEATWPGLHQAISHSGYWKNSNANIVVKTDIGGARCIDKLTSTPGGWLVHDACHSWLPISGVDFAFMSCYPTKLVAGAEGGVMFVQSKDHVHLLERLLYCGLTPGKGGPPVGWGRKANMTDVAAALNLEALQGMRDYAKAIEESWYKFYHTAYAAGLSVRQATPRPYLLQVSVPAAKIPVVRQRLEKKGIATAWNFPPASLLTLPCWPKMPKSVVQLIVKETRHAIVKS